DSGEAFLRCHPKLLHLRRVHNSLNHREQNLDHEFGWNIFSDHSRALTLNEKFSEMPLDQSRSAALDHLEDMRRFLSHIANERRFDLVQLALRVAKEFMQYRREIVRIGVRNFL